MSHSEESSGELAREQATVWCPSPEEGVATEGRLCLFSIILKSDFTPLPGTQSDRCNPPSPTWAWLPAAVKGPSSNPLWDSCREGREPRTSLLTGGTSLVGLEAGRPLSNISFHSKWVTLQTNKSGELPGDSKSPQVPLSTTQGPLGSFPHVSDEFYELLLCQRQQ